MAVVNNEKRIRACIRDYEKRQKTYPYCEVGWFKSLSFRDALRNAALATNWKGKRFSHQYRLKKTTLLKAEQKLSALSKVIKSASDFDELLSIVENAISNIHGIGELYIYDFSLRVGANLELLPQRVYLHAGTKKGAIALGVNCRNRRHLELAELPRPFQGISPYKAEDILCIYKNHFKNIRAKTMVMPKACCIK